MKSRENRTLRNLLRQLSQHGHINAYAVALILTERSFRGPVFRLGELLYALFCIVILRVEPRVTIGHCQVSFSYWRQRYGTNWFRLLLSAQSVTVSYEICCAYLAANPTDGVREMLIRYNGRPSKLYVVRFMHHLDLVRSRLPLAGRSHQHFQPAVAPTSTKVLLG